MELFVDLPRDTPVGLVEVRLDGDPLTLRASRQFDLNALRLYGEYWILHAVGYESNVGRGAAVCPLEVNLPLLPAANLEHGCENVINDVLLGASWTFQDTRSFSEDTQ